MLVKAHICLCVCTSCPTLSQGVLLLVGVGVGKRRPSIRKYLDLSILILIWILGSPVAGGGGGGW